MYGADADELDRLATEFTTTAERLDNEMTALTNNLRSIDWLGDVATAFSTDWLGAGMAKVSSTTSFLRAGASDLQQQAAAQRDASKGGSGRRKLVQPHPGRHRGATSADDIGQKFNDNRAAVEQYIAGLPDDSSLKEAIQKNLDAGGEVYYFDPEQGYIAWSTPNLLTASDVVLTIPGTMATLETVTDEFFEQAAGYQQFNPNVAVISTYTWRPPPELVDNLAYEWGDEFETLGDGPTPDILRQLSSAGKSVVPTAHSAGARAFDLMMANHPDVADTIAGVAFLAPSMVSWSVDRLPDKPILVAYHTDDPLGGITGYHLLLAPNGNVDVQLQQSGLESFIFNTDAHNQSLYISHFGQEVLDLHDGLAPDPTPSPMPGPSPVPLPQRQSGERSK